MGFDRLRIPQQLLYLALVSVSPVYLEFVRISIAPCSARLSFATIVVVGSPRRSRPADAVRSSGEVGVTVDGRDAGRLTTQHEVERSFSRPGYLQQVGRYVSRASASNGFLSVRDHPRLALAPNTLACSRRRLPDGASCFASASGRLEWVGQALDQRALRSNVATCAAPPGPGAVRTISLEQVVLDRDVDASLPGIPPSNAPPLVSCSKGSRFDRPVDRLLQLQRLPSTW
jgi:hypothetical protein